VPRIRGHVDGFEGTFLCGWAIALPGEGSCNIRVSNEAGDVIARGTAARRRKDLAALDLGRDDFSFQIPLTSLADTKQLHVYADDIEINGSPLDLEAREYYGTFLVLDGTAKGTITVRKNTKVAPLISIFDQDGTLIGEEAAIFHQPDDVQDFATASFDVFLRAEAYGRSESHLYAYANGVEFAQTRCELPLRGYLDVLTPTRWSGWLLSPVAPRKQFEIEVFRDGTRVAKGVCNISRPDLRDEFPGVGDAGFDLVSAPFTLEPMGTAEISVRLPGSDTELFDGPFLIGERPAIIEEARIVAQLAHSATLKLSPLQQSVLSDAMDAFIRTSRDRAGQFRLSGRRRKRGRTAQLCVIIPVYRDVVITSTCIESVLRHRNPDIHRIVLVNDCSPDEGMTEVRNNFSMHRNIFLLTNARNLGFVKTVNRAMQFCEPHDVVLLNSDTVIFAGALDELWHVAYSSRTLAP
jgi:hypothetical protein